EGARIDGVVDVQVFALRVDAMPFLLVDQVALAIVDAGGAERVVARVARQAELREGEVRSRRARRVVGGSGIDRAWCTRAVGQHLVGKQRAQVVGGLPEKFGAAGKHIRTAHARAVAGVGRAADGAAGAVAHPAVLVFLASDQAQSQLVGNDGNVD